MKTLCVLQHTEAEYLGLMEDHLEGRNIRFQVQAAIYARCDGAEDSGRL